MIARLFTFVATLGMFRALAAGDYPNAAVLLVGAVLWAWIADTNPRTGDVER